MLDVSGQDSAPKAVNFNNDGTKVFVLGTANKQVFECTLDTPFSLINVNDEHSGDVIDTSSTSSQDTDADGDTLTVASVEQVILKARDHWNCWIRINRHLWSTHS